MSDGSSVVHVIVAWVCWMFEDWIDEMVGGVMSVDDWLREAVQEAVVPPFEPWQVHREELPWAGSEGDEGDAVPVVQYAPWGKDSVGV